MLRDCNNKICLKLMKNIKLILMLFYNSLEIQSNRTGFSINIVCILIRMITINGHTTVTHFSIRFFVKHPILDSSHKFLHFKCNSYYNVTIF